VEPREVHDRSAEMDVLDVREDDEWSAGRIEGARHIPLGELGDRLGELDPERPVVTVCRTGGRASKAAKHLTEAGLSAQVMADGMQGWDRDGLPIRGADGTPGRVA
jgi:rhodanese-related sulfurtransferase